MVFVVSAQWFGGYRTWLIDWWSMSWWLCCAWKLQGKEYVPCKNHGHWYLVLWWALTVNVGSSWMDTTRTLSIQYRISELCIFKVRYCEMLRSELSVHKNSLDPRLDAVEFFRRRHWFLLGRNFEWCIRILCPTIFLGSDTVKVRSDLTKIKVRYW
mgnify:CR=1 FL=1